ncbi:primase-like DNA-binding domain-containing protein [Halochromatium salexigens]|uniref:primase-like DNA-binding domain-containing protein n=1 Tax=Halochromatium salexigens TaxID=49447 RepID=UPI0019126692|nr:primase-like DNA-binding domain-containing protein [Halochromatium salexigens]
MGEQKLWAERAGVLDWIIEEAVEWYRNGLQVPKVIRDESAAYRKDSDTLGQFLDQETTQAPSERVAQRELWNLWRRYCEHEGLREGSKKSFTQRLAERGHASSKSGPTWFYDGLTLESAEHHLAVVR